MLMGITDYPVNNFEIIKRPNKKAIILLYNNVQIIEDTESVQKKADVCSIELPYYNGLKDSIGNNFEFYWNKAKKEEYDILFKKFSDLVQAHMDVKAKEKNYDSIASACSYENSDIEKFRNEGIKARKWRDLVWNTCYKILNDVIEGKREVPTDTDLISELPVLDW